MSGEISGEIVKVCMAIEREVVVHKEHEKHSQLPHEWDSKRLERELQIYKAGLQRVIPDEWSDILKEHNPDYKEYLRLKKKFEEG